MITIIDYGTGNVSALGNILKNLKVEFQVSSDNDSIINSDKYILPGVGSFDNAMQSIDTSNIKNLLQQEVLENKKHILGICIGMQILSNQSEEGSKQGLGWIPGYVRRFDKENLINLKLPLPHMGWNSIKERVNSHPLLKDIDLEEGFYFLHNYFFCPEYEESTIATSNYGINFTCAVSNNNIHGVKFHPEKSHDNGIQLLKNFALI